MSIAPDYSLYLCTDRILSMGRPITDAVEQAILGGVTLVQIREKDATTREFYEIAGEIQQVTKKYGVPLVVNDRIDIAMAIGAEGLHLGQSDMPLSVARSLVKDSMFIGISASTLEEALAAQDCGADYLGVGAVYLTDSKAGVEEAIGPEGLARICSAVSIPVVGIGGIGPANVDDVMAAGAEGVAVISAILSQPDISAAARALRERIK